MRIVHTSDWHLGKNIEGESRLEEQKKFIDFFVDKCEEIKPDMILIAGDIYDTSNPPASAERLFYNALKRLSRNGDCVTVVIAGNHDNPDRLVSATPLAIEHGIIMLGTSKTVAPLGDYGKSKIVNSGEGFFEIEINKEKAVVLTMPYPSEKRLNEIFYKDDENEDERVTTYGEKIKSIFDGLKNKFTQDTINIVVAHLFAFGAEAAGSERSTSLGGSFIVNLGAFPDADYVALGHIHKPQVLAKTEKHIRYSGSPIHYNISEPSTNKMFYVIDVEKKEEAKIDIQEVEIPVFKPIVLWRAGSVDEAIELCKKNSEKDSWVYLEIQCDAVIKETEIKEMKSYKKDILEIRAIMKNIEEESNIHRISELPFDEQFIEFFTVQKGVAPDKEMVEYLLTLIEEVENETD